MEEKASIGWIYGDISNSDKNPEIIYFRKKICLDKIQSSLKIDITADSKYKLYINDTLVNVGPQKGDKYIWYYDTLEISEHLKAGENTVLVEVMTVPDRSRGGNFSFARTRTPGLYIDGEMGFKCDSSWEYCINPVKIIPEDSHFFPLYIFENGEGFDKESCNWKSANIYEPFFLSERLKPDNLLKRTIPLIPLEDKKFTGVENIRESSEKRSDWEGMVLGDSSLILPSNSKHVIELSAGEETTGFLKFIFQNGKDSKIEILTSECYAYELVKDSNGPTLPKKGNRTDSVNGNLYGFKDYYNVGGFGESDNPEIYEPFWFRTFRYIKLTIETGSEPLIISDINYKYFAYPLDVKTSVETSDETMESIWDISERTLRLCMHETYEDCPFYEQLQYAQDTRSQILYTYAVSADDRLAREAMESYRRSIRADGMINCSYPNYEDHVIPGFGIFYIAMVYDHMLYFGDKEFIKEHIPAILNVLNFFRKFIDSETGMLGKIGGPLFQEKFWSFIDWTDQWRETIGTPPATKDGPLTMESFYFVTALQQTSSLLSYLEYNDFSNNLNSEAESIKASINKNCRGMNGLYQDGPGVELYSQHCQVFAILTDTIPVEEGRRLLSETFKDKELYPQCSVAMMFYLFRALEKCGEYNRTNELWDIWRNMVKKNLSTCEEDSVLSRSDCHAWGSLALYELPTTILGVRPVAPGYSKVKIDPVPGHFKWAKGEVKTPKGTIKVSWEKDGDLITLTSDVPDGIEVI